METSGGIQASLAGRYALALFELARDNGQIDSVGNSLAAVKAALAEVADFYVPRMLVVVGLEPVAALRATAA